MSRARSSREGVLIAMDGKSPGQQLISVLFSALSSLLSGVVSGFVKLMFDSVITPLFLAILQGLGLGTSP